jgi:hypothetical protein
VATLRPSGPEVVALDGKALRRSHYATAARAVPLRLVTAWAPNERLVSAQEALPDPPERSHSDPRHPGAGRSGRSGHRRGDRPTTPQLPTAIQQASEDFVLPLKAS